MSTCLMTPTWGDHTHLHDHTSRINKLEFGHFPGLRRRSGLTGQAGAPPPRDVAMPRLPPCFAAVILPRTPVDWDTPQADGIRGRGEPWRRTRWSGRGRGATARAWRSGPRPRRSDV